MSFSNAKAFVSRSIVNEDGETPINTNDGSDAPQKQIDNDPRTLYERLKEQRIMKEEAFQEANRASNLIKRVDDDEAAFYQTLSDTQSKLLEEVKQKENAALQEFRKAVEEARTAPAAPVATKVHAVTATASRKISNKTLSGLVLVKKKRDAPEDGEEKKEAQVKKAKVETATKAPAPASSPAPTSSEKPSNNALLSLVSYDDSDSGSDDGA